MLVWIEARLLPGSRSPGGRPRDADGVCQPLIVGWVHPPDPIPDPRLGNLTPTQLRPQPSPHAPRLGHVVTLLDAEHAVVQRVLAERDAVAPEAQGLGLL